MKTNRLTYLICTLAVVAFACSDGPEETDGPGGGGNGGGGNGDGNNTETRINVSTVEELNALTGLTPGDTVVLANGVYNSKDMAVTATGTGALPIVFMAETPGKAIFTGASSLAFSGEHLVFSGFMFRDVVPVSQKAVITFRRSSSLVASNCRVTDCAITGSGLQEDPDNDFKWVSIYGFNNRVDNCSFVDKKNIGCLLVVWLPSTEGTPPAHHIDHNYFSRPTILLDSKNKAINGQETIRIGTSDTSMQNASCVVEANTFYMCDGEIEIISSKSCGNTYKGNFFRKCMATLTLRHGNDCVVEGNIFDGENAPSSGGTRLNGENHVVRNNHYRNLAGSGYRTAICLMTGIENSPANGYHQTRNALITGNTIVDCENAFNISYGSDGTLPVVGTTISNNTVSNTSKTAIQVNATTLPTEVKWSGNTVWGGKYSGITEKDVPFATTRPDVASVDAKAASIANLSGVSWKL